MADNTSHTSSEIVFSQMMSQRARMGMRIDTLDSRSSNISSIGTLGDRAGPPASKKRSRPAPVRFGDEFASDDDLVSLSGKPPPKRRSGSSADRTASTSGADDSLHRTAALQLAAGPASAALSNIVMPPGFFENNSDSAFTRPNHPPTAAQRSRSSRSGQRHAEPAAPELSMLQAHRRHVTNGQPARTLRQVVADGGDDALGDVDIDAMYTPKEMDESEMINLIHTAANRMNLWSRPADPLFTQAHYMVFITHRVIHDILYNIYWHSGGILEIAEPQADNLVILGQDNQPVPDGQLSADVANLHDRTGKPLTAKCMIATSDPMAHAHEPPPEDAMRIPLCVDVMRMLEPDIVGMNPHAPPSHPNVLTLEDFIPTQAQVDAFRQRQQAAIMAQTELTRDPAIQRTPAYTFIMNMTAHAWDAIKTAADCITWTLRSNQNFQHAFIARDVTMDKQKISRFLHELYPPVEDAKKSNAIFVQAALDKISRFKWRKGLYNERPYIFSEQMLACGRSSHFWAPELSIEKFVRTFPDPATQVHLWVALRDYSGLPHEITKLLYDNIDPQFPSVSPQARYYSFTNGIYLLSKQKFVHVGAEQYLKLPSSICTYVSYDQPFCIDGFDISIRVSLQRRRHEANSPPFSQTSDSLVRDQMSQYSFDRENDTLVWTLRHTKALYRIFKKWHFLYNPVQDHSPVASDVNDAEKSLLVRAAERDVTHLCALYPDLSPFNHPAAPVSPSMLARIRAGGTGRALSSYDWHNDCPVPILDMIVRETNELPPDACDFIDSSLGRTLYNLGDRESAYHVVILVGPGGCGKSTIINLLLKLFPARRVGMMGDASEEQFGLMHTVDPKSDSDRIRVDIIVDPDSRGTAGIPLTQFLKMITCEAVSIAVKNQSPVQIDKWNKPMLFASNTGITVKDVAGAVSRRVIHCELSKLPKKSREILDAEYLSNVPFLLKRINFAYHAFANKCRRGRISNILSVVPPIFRKATLRAQVDTNIFLQLLTVSGWILLGMEEDASNPSVPAAPGNISFHALQCACSAFAAKKGERYAHVLESVVITNLTRAEHPSGLEFEYIQDSTDPYPDYDRTIKKGARIINARFSDTALRTIQQSSHHSRAQQ